MESTSNQKLVADSNIAHGIECNHRQYQLPKRVDFKDFFQKTERNWKNMEDVTAINDIRSIKHHGAVPHCEVYPVTLHSLII